MNYEAIQIVYSPIYLFFILLSLLKNIHELYIYNLSNLIIVVLVDILSLFIAIMFIKIHI